MTREEQLKKEYKTKLAELKREQNNCEHNWAEPIYDPDVRYEPSDYVKDFTERIYEECRIYGPEDIFNKVKFLNHVDQIEKTLKKN